MIIKDQETGERATDRDGQKENGNLEENFRKKLFSE